MLWEFENKKNATETSKKCIIYGQGVITDHQIQNWFSKFPYGDKSLRDEFRPRQSSDLDQGALREFVECNPCKSTRELVLDHSTSLPLPLEKDRKSGYAWCLGSLFYL